MDDAWKVKSVTRNTMIHGMNNSKYVMSHWSCVWGFIMIWVHSKQDVLGFEDQLLGECPEATYQPFSS